MLAWWLIFAELGAARSRAIPIPKFLQEVTLEKNPRWPCFLASALLHVFMLAGLPALSDWFQATRPELWMHRYRVLASVEIRVPERLYLATTPSPRRKPATTPAKPARGTERTIRPSASRDTALRAASGAKRRFELPRLVPRQSDLTLLQPDFPGDLPVLGRVSLPDLLIWSPLPNHPAFRIRKPFVTPGSAEPFAQQPAFDAPPQLTAPNWEALAAELQAAAARASNPESPLQPAISLPIRLPDLLTRPPHTYISTERSVGDPLSVLALNVRPRPVREDLIIPPGNQLAVAHAPGTSGINQPASAGGAQGTERQAGGAASEPTGTGSAQTRQSTPQPAAASASARDARQPGSEAAATSAARNAGPQGDSQPASPPRNAQQEAVATTRSEANATAAGSALSPANQTNQTGPPAESAPPARGVVRIDHPPGAVADVVVVQPAPMDGAIETSGALSGRPVYSVFLQVGAPRQWILQYCVPGEDQSMVVTGGVVRLSSPAPLAAPYPKVTYLPPVRPKPGSYLLIHGYLNTAGRFEALQPLRGADREEAAAIIPVLERWEFRPAMREGQPVRIEILLAIPRG
jgi:hypothetical protein